MYKREVDDMVLVSCFEENGLSIFEAFQRLTKNKKMHYLDKKYSLHVPVVVISKLFTQVC